MIGGMDSIRRDLVAKRFQLTLAKCELRQCGTDTPIIYAGPGVVSQEADGNLLLRVLHTDEIAEDVKWDRFYRSDLTPGVIVPDTHYYDLEATDNAGNRWVASRQSIDENFGAITEVAVRLRRFERVQTIPNPNAGSSRAWFVPFEVDLPLNGVAKDGQSVRFDRFEYDGQDYFWRIRKGDAGLHIEFRSKRGTVEPDAKHFLRALAILFGRAIEPTISQTVEGHTWTTRIHPQQTEVDGSTLLQPLPLRTIHPPFANEFLRLFVDRAVVAHPSSVPQGRIIYQFWQRILRAQERDIENSSLVLSVAIEGVLKEIFHSEHDRDTSFAPLAAAAETIIAKAPIDERVRTALLKSLKSADNPKPKDALIRMMEQGAIKDDHIKAWEKMRHTGAHGGLLGDTDGELQKHFNRYLLVLDLFYRLMFVALGYRGPHVDYSTTRWPQVAFLAIEPASSAVEATHAAN